MASFEVSGEPSIPSYSTCTECKLQGVGKVWSFSTLISRNLVTQN